MLRGWTCRLLLMGRTAGNLPPRSETVLAPPDRRRGGGRTRVGMPALEAVARGRSKAGAWRQRSLPATGRSTIPLRHPKVGDVVVVEHPGRPGYEMVKRIAAGAGRPCRRSHARRRRMVGRGRSGGSLDGQPAVRSGPRRRVEGQGGARLLASRAPPARVAAVRGTRLSLVECPLRRSAVRGGSLLFVGSAPPAVKGERPDLSRSASTTIAPSEDRAAAAMPKRAKARRRGRGRRGRGPHRPRRRGGTHGPGRTGARGRLARRAAVRRANDWEPATAADPSAPTSTS